MTKRRDFKALVRERMDKTGERYTAARAQVLGNASASPTRHSFPGVLPGYNTFGGIQSGTAALRNLLASIGAVSPLDGAPYTESLVNGLCGGPGFLYAVFEYKGWPPLVSLALRSRSMPDVYIAEGVSRDRANGNRQRDHESRRRAQGARCRARGWQGGALRHRCRVAAVDGTAGGLRRRRAARGRGRRTRWRRLLDRRSGRASPADERGAACRRRAQPTVTPRTGW